MTKISYQDGRRRATRLSDRLRALSWNQIICWFGLVYMLFAIVLLTYPQQTYVVFNVTDILVLLSSGSILLYSDYIDRYIYSHHFRCNISGDHEARTSYRTPLMALTNKPMSPENIPDGQLLDYDTLARTIDDILVTLDLEGQLTTLNPAFERVLGWAVDRWLGKQTGKLIHPGDLVETEGLLDALRDKGMHILELRVRAQNGEYRLLEIFVYPLFDGDEISGLMGLARDITDRYRRTETDLQIAREQERKKLLARFVKNISHDLRTPLSVIGTNAYLARKKLDSQREDDVRSHLTQIEDHVSKLSERLSNLLTIAHFESHVSDFVFVSQDVNQLVQNIVDEVRPYAEDRGHDLRFVAAPAPAVASVDAQSFRRSIWHLVWNAINYTPEGGHILVQVVSADDEIQVTVQDDGIGITAEELDHVFELFYRADEARNHDTGGMGLGLKITRQLIEAHGGRVEVVSEPGQGSTFSVFVPVTH